MAKYRLVNGERVEITGEELAQLEAEEKAREVERQARQQARARRRARIQAYREKGWVRNNDFDALSFFEDMSSRTPALVLAELKLINDGLL